jgi:hypothetical protein
MRLPKIHAHFPIISPFSLLRLARKRVIDEIQGDQSRPGASAFRGVFVSARFPDKIPCSPKTIPCSALNRELPPTA